jgi:uncharacterized phage-like protein YoqJ
MKTCCFIGYNPFNLPFGSDENNPFCNDLKAIIRHVLEKVINDGHTYFICGFDRGSDVYFAEILLELKLKNPLIMLESAIPYENQASKWTENDRERYYNLLAKCDYETMLQTQYTSDCILKRNIYIIKKSDLLITVYNGKLSRVMETINYAQKLNKRIICINPETLEVTEK